MQPIEEEHSTAAAFDIAIFDRLASDADNIICIEWEPLSPCISGLKKMSDMLRLSAPHYSCLMEYYAGVYSNAKLCAEGAYLDDDRTMVINLVRKTSTIDIL